MAQPLINPKNNETQSYIFIPLIFLSVASKAFQAGCSMQMCAFEFALCGGSREIISRSMN